MRVMAQIAMSYVWPSICASPSQDSRTLPARKAGMICLMTETRYPAS